MGVSEPSVALVSLEFANIEHGNTSERREELTEAPNVFEPPPADTGAGAWKFLAGCFLVEALLWGAYLPVLAMLYDIWCILYTIHIAYGVYSVLCILRDSVYLTNAARLPPLVRRFPRLLHPDARVCRPDIQHFRRRHRRHQHLLHCRALCVPPHEAIPAMAAPHAGHRLGRVRRIASCRVLYQQRSGHHCHPGRPVRHRLPAALLPRHHDAQ